jgi:hypothetical protein
MIVALILFLSTGISTCPFLAFLFFLLGADFLVHENVTNATSMSKMDVLYIY